MHDGDAQAAASRRHILAAQPQAQRAVIGIGLEQLAALLRRFEHTARCHVGLALKQTVEQFVLGRHIEMADNPDFLAQGAGDLDTETGQAPRFVAIGHRRRIIGNDDAQGSRPRAFGTQRGGKKETDQHWQRDTEHAGFIQNNDRPV